VLRRVGKCRTSPKFGYRIESEGMPRLAGTVHVEHFDYTADSLPQKDVPQGKLERFEWKNSQIFPDTVRDVTVYLPAGFQPGEETCLMVWQDGTRHVDPKGPMRASVVFDNLIHKKEMPRTVGVFIDPGRMAKQKPGDKAANRSFEYDSLGDAYVRFLLERNPPRGRKALSAPSSARSPKPGPSPVVPPAASAPSPPPGSVPDKFHKVLCWVGTFVDIRGGNHYPYLVRITERKPIRVYLLDGENDLDNKFGNWPLANKMMAASLKYMNYDFRIDWTKVLPRQQRHGRRASPTPCAGSGVM
jgi:hypothetical protein